MKLIKYTAKALLTMLLALLPLTHIYAQGRTVTGTITDKSGPVVGVSVLVEG